MLYCTAKWYVRVCLSSPPQKRPSPEEHSTEGQEVIDDADTDTGV